MKDVLRTVISQYANSPSLVQLVKSMNEFFDPAVNFAEFYDAIWNIDTAKGFGLDIWGRIVNVPRVLTIPVTASYLGFDGAQGGSVRAVLPFLAPAKINGLAYLAPPTTASGADDSITGFDQSPFFERFGDTQNYRLEDEPYRRLILIKALANISNTSAPSINQLLRNLVGNRGRTYMRDDGFMQIAYVFEFRLQPFELAILTQTGVIPSPAGVRVDIVQLDMQGNFGFSEQTGAQPFDYGVFFSPTVLT